ncbi:MAG: hypothetical protein RLZZ534_355 [Actinomycetota bacterium]
MILRIGLDFDNTIANYDQAFPEVARILGYETNNFNATLNKRDLKLKLLKQPDGDTAWQKVQGLVYGKFIDLASLYPGVYEFVLRALASGNEIFIVSHKTELGHFDESRTPLRQAATTWLINQKLVGDSDSKIKLQNIFYAETRDEKINKIVELQLDVFIDDLDEVLSDRSFPKSTRKILFGSVATTSEEILAIQSWREVGDELFGEIDANVILAGAKHVCPDLNCSSAQRVEGRGNSKIFRVETSQGSIALKVYPDLAVDNRLRRNAEWQALKFLQHNKLPVPKPVQTDAELNWSLIEWIDGSPADPQNQVHLGQAATFIQNLNQASRAVSSGSVFGLATEACLNPSLIETQINNRLAALKLVKDSALRDFVDNSVSPTLVRTIERSRRLMVGNYDTILDQRFWTLSPSDFGLHNAIATPQGDLVFFDFEYFGWDDPVKLTADVCLHPGMSLDESAQQFWISEAKRLFTDDPNFGVRLNALYPLYVIRWALIMLNEYRTDKIKNRLNAQSRMQSDIRGAQLMQLEKAKLMLKNADRTVS